MARGPRQARRALDRRVDRSRQLFRAVIGKRSGLAVQRKFRAVILELVLDELRDQRIADPEVEPTGRFLAGALVELLIGWLDAPSAVSALVVERRFVRLALPVLEAARGA